MTVAQLSSPVNSATPPTDESPVEIPGLNRPILYKGHQLKVAPFFEQRLKSNCRVCEKPLGTRAGLVQRGCKHILHTACYFKGIPVSGILGSCEYKFSECRQAPNTSRHFDNMSLLVKSAPLYCTAENCIYTTEGNDTDDSEVAKCSYPGSLFPPEMSAAGFLHNNVDLISNILIKFFDRHDFKLIPRELRGLSNKEIVDLDNKFGANKLLATGIQQLDTMGKELEHLNKNVREFNNKQSNSKNATTSLTSPESEARPEASDTDPQPEHAADINNDGGQPGPAMIPEIDSGLFSELKKQVTTVYDSLLEHEKSSSLPISLSRYIKTDRNIFKIPGLSSVPDKNIELHFSCTPKDEKQLELINFKLESKTLNKKNESAADAINKVINFARCLLIGHQMKAKNPDCFNHYAKAHLIYPFDYFNNEIKVQFYEKTIAIPLNQVINIKEKSVNHMALKNELKKRDIDYDALGEDRRYLRNHHGGAFNFPDHLTSEYSLHPKHLRSTVYSNPFPGSHAPPVSLFATLSSAWNSIPEPATPNHGSDAGAATEPDVENTNNSAIEVFYQIF